MFLLPLFLGLTAHAGPDPGTAPPSDGDMDENRDPDEADSENKDSDETTSEERKRVPVVPFAGLEWSPLSRGDVVWSLEERTSGVAVGEFDGLVRPNLTAFFGVWLSRRIGLVGGLGVARLQNTTWEEDVYRQRHWGVVRPHLDLRIAPMPRTPRGPFGWLVLGAHGGIPSARDVSNGYTDEEQTAADETATAERAALAGVGARLGGGVEVRLLDYLSLGGQYTVEWHRNLLLSNDSSVVSSFLTSRATVLLTVDWGRTPEANEPPPAEGAGDIDVQAEPASETEDDPEAEDDD